MPPIPTASQRTLLATGLLATGLLAALPLARVPRAIAAEMTGGHAQQVFSTELPNVPGKRLSAVVVSYPPGAASPAHHHAGSVFAYVLTGTIRSQNSATGAARDYKAGDSFFEPPGSEHLISANASTTEPASLLAIFVVDDGAVLTTPSK